MANIAQMVNVLQSVILTEGEKMILTPTYHVFNMYKYHQGGELLDSHLETFKIGIGEWQVPNLQESVSMGKDGKIHVTINNLSVRERYLVDAVFTETSVMGVEGTILTGKMHDHNSFEEPNVVHTMRFFDYTLKDNHVTFTIPACSVLHLAIKV